MLALRKHSTTKYFPAKPAAGNTPSKSSSLWLFLQPCFVQTQLCCSRSTAACCAPQGKGWLFALQSLRLPQSFPCLLWGGEAPHLKDRCH